MTLAPGARLGPSEIISAIGAGDVGAPLVGALDATPDARERAGTRPEGEDLSAHIARGPIPIAEALEAAHEQVLVTPVRVSISSEILDDPRRCECRDVLRERECVRPRVDLLRMAQSEHGDR